MFFHLPAVSSEVHVIAVTDIRFWGVWAVLMCLYDQTEVEVSRQEMIRSRETNKLRQMKDPFRSAETDPFGQSHGRQDV